VNVTQRKDKQNVTANSKQNTPIYTKPYYDNCTNQTWDIVALSDKRL